MFYNIFRHFSSEKFGHVKNLLYLCTRNRKGKYLNILRRKRTGQRWGATREGYGGVKHIPRERGRKAWNLLRFRVPRFSLPNSMRPTYFQLWDIIFETLKFLVHRFVKATYS